LDVSTTEIVSMAAAWAEAISTKTKDKNEATRLLINFPPGRMRADVLVLPLFMS
jgi:hypothetical protein